MYGIDDNPAAIALAELNKKHTRLTNVEFVQQDVLKLPALIAGANAKKAIRLTHFEETISLYRADLIVANPPYIPVHRWPSLQREIRMWEDPHALVADDQGLGVLQAIVRMASMLLTPPRRMLRGVVAQPPPQLVLEIGEESQAVAVSSVLRECDFLPTVHRDLRGCARWVSAVQQPKSWTDEREAEEAAARAELESARYRAA